MVLVAQEPHSSRTIDTVGSAWTLLCLRLLKWQIGYPSGLIFPFTVGLLLGSTA
jgi:hypothetical protein